MNTHDLARQLRDMASLLEKSPPVEIGRQFGRTVTGQGGAPESSKAKPRKSETSSLKLLIELSNYSKKEWLELVRSLGLNVDVRPRDASRDIMGKVLSALEDQPDAIERLQKSVRNRESHGSPELANALSFLLK